MYKFKFYSSSILQQLLVPNSWYRNRLKYLLHNTTEGMLESACKRANYYFKRNTKFHPQKNFYQLSSLSCFNKSAYYYDLLSTLRYYPTSMKFQCWLRDVITVPKVPCFVKCRPIDQDNDNSAILKLNQVRHYRNIHDSTPFLKKEPKLVWRGSVFQRHWRAEFVKKFFDNPVCNIGALKGTGGILIDRYEKNYLSIEEQLKYKFVFSIEGADVATNLKWIAQSNSLCFMKKPTHESWFMENSLIPDFHYVSIDDSFDNVTEKIQYYLDNPNDAEAIISNMRTFYSQFENKSNEVLISLLVALKYFHLSEQLSIEDMGLGHVQNDFLGLN